MICKQERKKERNKKREKKSMNRLKLRFGLPGWKKKTTEGAFLFILDGYASVDIKDIFVFYVIYIKSRVSGSYLLGKNTLVMETS